MPSLVAISLRASRAFPKNLQAVTTSSKCYISRRSLAYRGTTLNNTRTVAQHSARRQFLQKYGALGLTPLPVFLLCSKKQSFLCHLQQFTAVKQEEEEEEEEVTALLATSAILMKEHDPSMSSRFVQWCKEFIENLWEAIQVSLRISEIAIRFSPLMILSPAAILASKMSDPEHENPVSDLAWKYFMHVVQRLGPGYVKLCQWVATRRDIFPVFVCDRLSQLHDQGYPHSWNQSVAILKESFGDDYEENGLHLEEVIGCGSAAQVYRGSLTTRNNDTGQEVVKPVAVKILHPWFQRQITNDLWLMDAVAKWLHSLPSETIKMVCLPRAVQTFGENLRRQADLTLESDNLQQFRHNFYGDENNAAASAILFPRPMEGWVSSKVLVEDMVENATPISEFLKDNTDLGLQTRKELAGPLLRAFLKMVFSDNFVHADIHPGNVLIQTTTTTNNPKRRSTTNLFSRMFQSNETTENSNNNDTSTTTKRSIVFLDAGIVTSLNENDRKNLKDLFKAVILNDGYDAGRLMVERARYERCSQTPGGVEAFATGVANIVSEFHDRRKSGLTLGAVRIGSLLGDVLDLCRVHGVEIDPAMASIVISTLVLEGLGRSLEPTLNLMDCAVPFVLGRGKV